MIKLTLTSRKQFKTYVFEKNCITIGKISETGVEPDLALPDHELKAVHVKIEYIDSQFKAFNIAEDPFVTLNDLPFSKKTLHSGDKLQIGSTLLHFDAPLNLEDKAEIIDADHDYSLSSLLDKKMHPLNGLDFDHEKVELEQEIFSPNDKSPTATRQALKSMSDEDVEALFLKVEELERNSCLLLENQLEEPVSKDKTDSIPKDYLQSEKVDLSTQVPSSSISVASHQLQLPQTTSSQSPPFSQQARYKSMKDDLTSELEDESIKKKNSSITNSSLIAISWKAVITSIVALFLLIVVFSICFYLAVIGHNQEKEIRAAQAVADVAMALNFAQINHAQPQNQNWSNPDFLKHNLKAVIAPPYVPLADIDSQGLLLNSSYILRLYTGSDSKHFLIIAQPTPGLLQWLIPKAAITVDSSLMELRKITDLKTLNRLLINATLDTSNSTDIANFVRLGELIPLAELKRYHTHAGFDMPKALAYIHPGAENLIYNGVRYYPLGEALMRKAISAYESEDNSQDIPPLIDEISRFSQFPNLVLYSSGGLQMAQRGQIALSVLFPKFKFLHGYLQFNSQHFAINSHLLIDDSGDYFNAEEKNASQIAEAKKENEAEEIPENKENPIAEGAD